MTRTVTLVLVDQDGQPFGALPPFEVSTPWWQDVREFGRDVQVLRLLHGDRPAPPGGHVTYLAQTDLAQTDLAQTDGRPATVAAPDVDLAPHPHRAAYAEPGGPAASIAWARESLTTLGVPGATAHQHRTWNLSAIWRLDDAAGEPVAWLKQVPSFFAHEPVALGLVGGVVPGLVPPLLAAGTDGRMLLAHVPGEDRYGAGAEVRARIAEAVHPVQEHFGTHPAAGIPERRLDAARFARVAEPFYDTIDGLRALIDDLPSRFAEVAACGLPDTLVHGDLHPGNVRVDDEGRLTILDWGDCTIGHPAFDILRLTGDLPDPEPLVAQWARRWRETVPGSDPLRAAELLRPIEPLLGAVVYAGFLEAIEPAEWPYHAGDVPAGLAAAVVAASIVGG